ncbi:DNA/RNA nuclease SfsA [endosymbiont 'TC1' of Trimyema compressum]|uniref:DNA/RNA nuclease SfsA n=1 Tax=endosymbiont 'TC1' of Trimyema compressum TaxID=243899 RepID=UPI000ADF1BF2
MLKKIKELSAYGKIKKEASIMDSRIDFYLSNEGDIKGCYVEVKGVTLVDDKQVALFPDDAPTERGSKHIETLIELKEAGYQCVIFLIQHPLVCSFTPNSGQDLKFANLVTKAIKAGVKVLCYNCNIALDKPIRIGKVVSFKDE